MPDTLYTPEEAAVQLRVTQRTVYTWLRKGELRGLKAGRAWRIRRDDLQAFLERHLRGGSKHYTSPHADRAARAKAGRGKFAYLKTGSDELAARKEEEIEREDRRR